MATQASGGSDPKPPPRVRGMLGAGIADRFGRFGDYEPPARRSQIDEFRHADVVSVLDGDLTPEKSRRLAKGVRAALKQGRSLPKRPHGGHRYGTGWDKNEFDPGWGVDEVGDWIRALIDRPGGIHPADMGVGFVVSGMYRGTRGDLIVRPLGGNAWHIAAAYPQRLG